MKRNILKATLVAAIALVASVTVYNAQKPDMEMSDAALANVEALASEETASAHKLECEGAGVKACSATCNKCNVTLTLYGNGKTAIITCYQ